MNNNNNSNNSSLLKPQIYQPTIKRPLKKTATIEDEVEVGFFDPFTKDDEEKLAMLENKYRKELRALENDEFVFEKKKSSKVKKAQAKVRQKEQEEDIEIGNIVIEDVEDEEVPTLKGLDWFIHTFYLEKCLYWLYSDNALLLFSQYNDEDFSGTLRRYIKIQENLAKTIEKKLNSNNRTLKNLEEDLIEANKIDYAKKNGIQYTPEKNISLPSIDLIKSKITHLEKENEIWTSRLYKYYNEKDATMLEIDRVETNSASKSTLVKKKEYLTRLKMLEKSGMKKLQAELHVEGRKFFLSPTYNIDIQNEEQEELANAAGIKETIENDKMKTSYKDDLFLRCEAEAKAFFLKDS